MFGNSDAILDRSNGKWISGYRSSITDRHCGLKNFPTVIEAAGIPLTEDMVSIIHQKLINAYNSLYKLNIFLEMHTSIIRLFSVGWIDVEAMPLNIEKRIKKAIKVIDYLFGENLTIENIIYNIFPIWKFTKLLQYSIFIKDNIVYNDNRLDVLINKAIESKINISRVWDYSLHLDMQYSLENIHHEIKNSIETKSALTPEKTRNFYLMIYKYLTTDLKDEPTEI